MAILVIAFFASLVVYFGLSAIIAAVAASVSRAPLDNTPASLGLAYENISFRSRVDNVILKGWYLPGGDKGVVIVVHGGKQNRADATMRLMELCCDLAKRGFNILTFDRRGCGEAEVPKAKGRAHFERDVGGAYDYIRERSGPRDKIFLLGISIGAVAVFLFAAHEEGICAIVSDSCFADTREMARRVLAIVSRILSCFAPAALWIGELIYGLQPSNAIDSVRLITCPVLFIHGEKDKGVPASDSVKLFEVSSNQLSELWVIPDADHSQAYSCNPTRYIDRVVSFLAGKCAASES
jgi:pimeloyl-ACP methyl ester carboxylesterase